MDKTKRTRKRLDREKLRKERDLGYKMGSWECPVCGAVGSAARGGEARHRNQCSGAQKHSQQPSSGLDTTPPASPNSRTSSDSFENPPPQPQRHVLKRTQRIESSESDQEPNPYIGPEGWLEENEINTFIDEPPVYEMPDIQLSPPSVTLTLGEVFVQKHPFSSSQVEPPHTLNQPPSIPLYWPFSTKQEYDQAALFFKTGHSKEAINSQLSINQDNGNQHIHYRNADELYSILDGAAALQFDKFEEREVVVPFDNVIHRCTMHLRNVHSAIADLVGDPTLFPYIRLSAERVYVRHPEKDANMRVIEEYWQADDMWSIQSSLGPGTSPLVLSVYVDETKLTAFGKATLWPIYIWLANLPSSIRAAHKKGGAVLVGYMPKVKTATGVATSRLSQLRAKVYHVALETLFESCQVAATVGDQWLFGDGLVRHGTVVIGIISTDYPELCRIFHNRGLNGMHPCPVCMVWSKDLHIGHGGKGQWPPRTSFQALQGHFQHETQKSTQDACQKLGLRAIETGLDSVTCKTFPLHQTIAFDALHMWGSGEFGRWWLPQLIERLSPAEKSAIDQKFMTMPSYPGVPRFAQGVTSLEWRSASDNYWIARLLTPILWEVLDISRPVNKAILRVFRSLGECTAVIKFTTISDLSLELLEHLLKELEEAGKVLLGYWEGFHLNTFKFHFNHSHTIPLLRQKGPIDCTDTGIGEAQHPQSKRSYSKTNKHPKEWPKQMLRRVQHQLVLEAIRTRLADREDEPEVEKTMLQQQQIRMGSSLPPIQLLRLLRTILPPQTSGWDEQKVVNAMQQFLWYHFSSFQQLGIGHPQPQHLPNLAAYKTEQHQIVYIPYISLLDSSLLVDKARCTENWMGTGRRQDFVLIKHDDTTFLFAELISVFSIKVEGAHHHIAFVHTLASPSQNRLTGQIHAKSSGDYRFVFVDTFVRTLLVHPPGSQEHYIINKLLDSDMYLRLQNA